MNLSVGIVGLPNVGKSTLFNALLKKQQALAANYPFATIEPNVGVVAVPDERLDKLAEITKEEEKMSGLPPIKNALIEFVDIAGLVKGASEGAGLERQRQDGRARRLQGRRRSFDDVGPFERSGDR